LHLEKDIPLLILNHNYLQAQGDKLFDRVATWPTLAAMDEDIVASFKNTTNLPDVVNPDRIFIADAERTFKNTENKKQFVKLLAHLSSQFKDYAQGLGYVSSFFLLTMSEAQAIALLSHINSTERYIPGYWKHEAIGFATDAYVFQSLLQKFNPEVAAHLSKNTIDPSTFCQKWFVGLCVHVLPLEYLFTFFEKFLVGGYPFLMQFGLSLVENLQTPLLEAKTASDIFAILRLELKHVPHNPALYETILANADNFNLKDINFAELRKEMYDKNLKKRIEGARFDEKVEIEDCAICKDDFPEVRCVECKINICENCHNDPPEDSPHIRGHKVKPFDEEEEEEEKEDKEEKAADNLGDEVAKLNLSN